MSWKLAALALVTVYASWACTFLTDPDLPAGAQRFSPPPVYERWWSMTQACTGISRRLSDVAWYHVPNTSHVESDGKWVTAYWSAASNRIVLAGDARFDGAAVRHEMAHALVRGRGHPRNVFLRACGGVVACPADCIADAGPPAAPDPEAVPVPSTETEVTVEWYSDGSDIRTSDGFLTFVVRARNPRPEPLIVQLPFRNAFLYEIRTTDDVLRQVGIEALDPEMTRFAPGEVKQQVFDVRLGVNAGQGELGRGDYTFTGFFGYQRASTDITIDF